MNHPTVEIFFVLAFTFCKVKVYKKEEKLARKLFEKLELEIVDLESSGRTAEQFTEIDTRVLLNLISQVIPKIIEGDLSSRIKTTMMEAFFVEPP